VTLRAKSPAVPNQSPAHQRWRTERCAALDSLERVHEKMTGNKRGRQYATEQLNLALFMSLAAQFQGFCRDLHDGAAVQIANSLAPGNDEQISVVRNALVRRRKLDVGNASPGGLGNDFAVLGMTFWADVHSAYPKKGAKWNTTMDDLNQVRNAVAHSHEAKITEVRRKHPLSLATFKKWRSSLHGAVYGFDKVVGTHLHDLTGIGWDEREVISEYE
jgi:hypothetical protein